MINLPAAKFYKKFLGLDFMVISFLPKGQQRRSILISCYSNHHMRVVALCNFQALLQLVIKTRLNLQPTCLLPGKVTSSVSSLHRFCLTETQSQIVKLLVPSLESLFQKTSLSDSVSEARHVKTS